LRFWRFNLFLSPRTNKFGRESKEEKLHRAIICAVAVLLPELDYSKQNKQAHPPTTMEGEGGGEDEAADAAAPTRWTCEACGCNTNLSTTDRCGICGTNNSGQ